ncbi:MAG: hypothetical protein ACREJU_17980 [Nitrospiraceae bacterium]
MNIVQPMAGRVALALLLGFLAGGCTSVPDTANRLVAVQSYDLPGTLNADAVIGVVERSFARALVAPPRVIEGSVPSPLPSLPAPFTWETRRVRLDRLGIVSIPRIGCPRHMAIIHGFASIPADDNALHSVTGCIQLYTGGYRVQIIENIVAQRQDREPIGAGLRHDAVNDVVTRIARMLVEQVSEARLAHASVVQESDLSSLQRSATASFDQELLPRHVAASVPTPSDPPIVDRGSHPDGDGWQVFPLVCLAPKRESALIRSQPEGGRVVKILDPGSILAVPEPIDSNFFHVRTAGGSSGWVNRSDVRRLPCPIG